MNTSDNSQLPFGKRLGALWSGATGKREEETLAYIETHDAASAPTPLGEASNRRRPRLQVLMAEAAENERKVTELQEKHIVKESEREELVMKSKDLTEKLPSWTRLVGWLALVSVLVLGDFFGSPAESVGRIRSGSSSL